jgi:hypothetical protein
MSMELIIGRKFEDYSKMFPDQIVNLSTEIQQAQSDVSILFENDI